MSALQGEDVVVPEGMTEESGKEQADFSDFNDEEITFNVVAQSTPKNTATDVLTGEQLEGKARMTFSFGPAPAAPAQVTYSVTLKPHSYKALKFE